MKKIILVTLISCLVGIGSKAQSSITNLDSAILKNRKTNGTALINTDETGLKLYVVYKNKKVSDIYAISKTGSKLNVTYKTSETITTAKEKNDFETTPIKCKACITTEDGKILRCWEIECSLLPPPKNPPKQHA